MRLAALAAGLALASAASAAEAPKPVDLVVEGQVVSVTSLGHNNWPQDIKSRVTMWSSHSGVYSVEVKVDRVHGGEWNRPGIEVVTDYQNWFPVWDIHAVFWLRRDRDGCHRSLRPPPHVVHEAFFRLAS